MYSCALFEVKIFVLRRHRDFHTARLQRYLGGILCILTSSDPGFLYLVAVQHFILLWILHVSTDNLYEQAVTGAAVEVLVIEFFFSSYGKNKREESECVCA